MLDSLVECGLLVHGPGCDKSPPLATSPPVTVMIDRCEASLIPFGVQAVLFARFLFAYASTLLRLKVFGLRHSINYLALRKLAARKAERIDKAHLYLLMERFWIFRVFTYTALNRCLLDSLVLSHFLLSNGVPVYFVIGVTTQPFDGHCWVQHESIALNETAERIERHTPIVVV
jgi:hypothetical protein